MENNDITYAFPHVRSSLSVGNAMRMMILALLPAAGFAVFHFGTRVLLHILVCVVSCVLSEFTFEAFANLPLAALDFSSAAEGLMLALLLPVDAPLWAGALGGVFATVVIKMILGVYLKIRLNAALAGYVLLLLAFPGFMRDYSFGEYGSATLLGQYLNGEVVDPFPMITGFTNGGMGVTSAAAIALGAVILLAAGVIRFRIPACACAAFALTLTIAGGNGFDPAGLVIQTCGGGFLFIIWFMAVDYYSSPVTGRGQVLYAAAIGVLAAVLRIFAVEEAAVYAVLVCDLLVPLFEKITVPKPFGSKGGMKAARL